jgi:hypothetical protein
VRLNCPVKTQRSFPVKVRLSCPIKVRLSFPVKMQRSFPVTMIQSCILKVRLSCPVKMQRSFPVKVRLSCVKVRRSSFVSSHTDRSGTVQFAPCQRSFRILVMRWNCAEASPRRNELYVRTSVYCQVTFPTCGGHWLPLFLSCAGLCKFGGEVT